MAEVTCPPKGIMAADRSGVAVGKRSQVEGIASSAVESREDERIARAGARERYTVAYGEDSQQSAGCAGRDRLVRGRAAREIERQLGAADLPGAPGAWQALQSGLMAS